MQFFEDTQGEEEFIMLNLAKPPFDNLLARQAVAHATDPETYATTIGEGILKPINGPFAEGQLGHLEDTGYPAFDLSRASQLVDEYEAATGQPLSFTLASVPTPQGLTEIQLLADMWSDAGMTVSLETYEQATHILRVITGDYQAAYWRLFSAVDPDGDYVWWHGRNAVDPPGLSLNFARNRDAELDAALDRARGTKDPAVRNEAYQEVSRRMAVSLPYIWLSRVTWFYAADEEVNGLENIMGGGLGSLAAKTWIGEIWLEGGGA
jgi:peptide/nickel transport system substrate-binding protein